MDDNARQMHTPRAAVYIVKLTKARHACDHLQKKKKKQNGGGGDGDHYTYAGDKSGGSSAESDTETDQPEATDEPPPPGKMQCARDWNSGVCGFISSPNKLGVFLSL